MQVLLCAWVFLGWTKRLFCLLSGEDCNKLELSFLGQVYWQIDIVIYNMWSCWTGFTGKGNFRISWPGCTWSVCSWTVTRADVVAELDFFYLVEVWRNYC